MGGIGHYLAFAALHQRAACVAPQALTRVGRMLAAALALLVGVADPLPGAVREGHALTLPALGEPAAHVAWMSRAG